MKADIIGIGWAEFTVRVLLGLEPHNQKIRGKIVEETEYTITVEFWWDGEKKLITLEK